MYFVRLLTQLVCRRRRRQDSEISIPTASRGGSLPARPSFVGLSNRKSLFPVHVATRFGLGLFSTLLFIPSLLSLSSSLLLSPPLSSSLLIHTVPPPALSPSPLKKHVMNRNTRLWSQNQRRHYVCVRPPPKNAIKAILCIEKEHHGTFLAEDY